MGKKIKHAWFNNARLLRGFPGKPQQIAVASIFTTQSATALLEQVAQADQGINAGTRPTS